MHGKSLIMYTKHWRGREAGKEADPPPPINKPTILSAVPCLLDSLAFFFLIYNMSKSD
jgi:hypothetical protein